MRRLAASSSPERASSSAIWRLRSAGAQALDLGDVIQVFARRHPVVEGGVLGQVAETGTGGALLAGGLQPGDPGAPGGGQRQPGEHAHGGGLAGAVAPQEAEDRAVGDGQVQVDQRLHRAIGFGQPLAQDGGPIRQRRRRRTGGEGGDGWSRLILPGAQRRSR